MKTFRRIFALVLASTLVSGTPLVAGEGATCDEGCMLDLATAYLDGLGVADASEVPLSRDHRLVVDNKAVPVGSGVWTEGAGWTYRHTVADPVNAQAVTFGVIRLSGEPSFMVVRIKQHDGKISESEILTARKGDFALFDPKGPMDADPVFGQFIPTDRRESRDALVATARGYFDGLIHADSGRTRFHPDCNRVENGVQTTNGAWTGSSSCSEGIRRFSYMRGYHDLRFPVVDPARGLVAATLFLDMPLQNRVITVRGKPVEISPERQHLPRSLYLFELFKIEDGHIRRIEAMMRNEAYGTRSPYGGDAATSPPLEEGE